MAESSAASEAWGTRAQIAAGRGKQVAGRRKALRELRCYTTSSVPLQTQLRTCGRGSWRSTNRSPSPIRINSDIPALHDARHMHILCGGGDERWERDETAGRDGWLGRRREAREGLQATALSARKVSRCDVCARMQGTGCVRQEARHPRRTDGPRARESRRAKGKGDKGKGSDTALWRNPLAPSRALCLLAPVCPACVLSCPTCGHLISCVRQFDCLTASLFRVL
jgi:hypothetical protein